MSTPTNRPGHVDSDVLYAAAYEDDPSRFDGLLESALAYERLRGREEAVERMQAMRRDYRTLPHAQFPLKWPDWKDYDEVLPSYCGCQDCRLWRSGS